jgi:hypothetical protein
LWEPPLYKGFGTTPEILYTKGLESPFSNVYLFLEYFSAILIYFLSKVIHLIIREFPKIIKGNLFTGIRY